MSKLCKKIINVFLISMMMISSIPFAELSGIHLPGVEVTEVNAAAASGDIDYLDDKHAKALIGFIYGVSELTDDMMNAGGMYTFITGGYKNNPVKEIGARIAFLTAAKTNISQCMSKYETVMENSYNQLLETLTEIAGGDIDDGLANDTLDEVVDSVEDIFLTLSETGEEVGEALKTVKSTYGSIASIPEKIKKMKQAMEVTLSSFFHVWSSNRANMYTYVSAYVSNRPLKDSCPSAFEATMSYNVFALNQNVLMKDPILDWASDEHLEVLDTFGDFIYQVQKSLVSYVSYSQTYKTYEVHCPTDVYLYKEDGTLALSIIDNVITIYVEGIYAAEYDSQKIFTVPSDQEYTLKITGTDTGVMDYKVSEYSAGSMVRFVEFNDLPVENTTEYTDVLPKDVYVSKDEYSLVNEDNVLFTADVDSLPDGFSDITDVVVAEELFKNFPEELVELVADVLFNMEKSVNLSGYDVSIDDAVALFSAIVKVYPSEYSLIANGDFSYQIVYNSTTNKMTEMRFDYGKDADLEKFKERVSALKTKIAEIVDDIEGLSDFEKALYVHDYLILNCEYDLELMELLDAQGKLSGEIRSERYTEYSVLVNQTGICGSYALAYRAILNAAGMDCIYLSSSQMDHAWNMVKIDGKWYHVDCCWDDPMPDRKGRVMRTYFLRTDKEMMNMNHYSWTPTQYKSVSETYSQMPRSNDDVLKYDEVNDLWYYLSYGNLYSMKKDGSNEKLVASDLDARAIEVDHGTLYLIEKQFIYEFDPETSEKQAVYYMSPYNAGSEPDQAYLYNAHIDGNNISVYQYQMDYVEVDHGEYELQGSFVRTEDQLQKEKLASITGIVVEYMPEEMELFETASPYAYLTHTGDYEIWDLVIEWSSSNENVISVDEYGTLTALNAGTETITASFLDFETSLDVTVSSSSGTPSGSCGTNITWSYDTDSRTLTLTGSGAMTDYTYRSAPWADYSEEIETIHIGSGITTVGNHSFEYFNQLNTVHLPDSMTSIGVDAFLYCIELVDIELPANVKTIKDSAFYNCISIEKLDLPEGLTVLERSAFQGCDSLESVVIPSAITEIDEYTFMDCSGLKTLDLNKVEYIERSAFQRCSSLTELVFSESLTIVGQDGFNGCKNLKKVTKIGDGLLLSSSVFANCTKLESVKFPDSMTNFYSSLFQNCESLKEITIPKSVTTIGYGVFEGCTSLEKIEIPASVTSISNQFVFSKCTSLKEILVDENNPNYSSDENGVLFNKDKTVLLAYPSGKTEVSYSIPEGVQTIESNAFYMNKTLESITMPDTVTSIGGNTFSQCKNLKDVTVSKNLVTLGGGAFAYDTSLRHIDLPEPLNTLGRAAFNGCTALEMIRIPNQIEKIDQWTFEECSSLKSIELPKSLKSIDYRAFYDCKQLIHVAYEGTEAEFEQISIYNPSNEYLLNAEYFHFEFNRDEDYEIADIVEATCTEAGMINQVSCKKCQLDLAGSRIEALGHDYQLSGHVEGNCETASIDTYTCTRCDDFYEVTGNPRDHHKYVKTVVEPTCTEKGYTQEVCSECGESSVSDFVSPTGHQLVLETDNVCENHGSISYQCKNCDYSERVTATIDAELIEIVTVEATCTQSGSTKEICELCGATVSVTLMAPKGHNYSEEWTIDQPATCKEAGQKSKHCTQCDAQKEITVIEVTEADHGETVLINELKSTCTEEGYSGDLQCTVCQKIVTEGEIQEKLGHSPEIVTGKNPTCTTDGWKDYYECHCGELFEDINASTPIESLETWKNSAGKVPASHDYDLTKWNKGDATGHWHDCKNCDGHDTPVAHTPDRASATEQHAVTCIVCGYVIEEKLEHVHKPTLVTGKNPTCTTDGWKDYYECHCGELFEDINAITPIESLETWKNSAGKVPASHDYDLTKWNKGDETGHWHDCKSCDGHDTPVAHTPDRASATEQHAVTCIVCGYVIEEKLEHVHKPTLVTGKNPTCTTDGWKDYYECHCGELFEDINAITPIESLETWKNSAGKVPASHDYDLTKWNKGDETGHWHDCKSCDGHDTPVAHTPDRASATEQHAVTCIVCGYVIEEKLEHVHKPTLVTGKNPTCTTDGWKDYYECRCGELFEDINASTPIESLETWKNSAGKVPASHDYDLTKWNKGDETGHWHDCKSCDGHDTPVAHTPDRASATEQHAVTCIVCGYVIEGALPPIPTPTPTPVPTPTPTPTPDTDDEVVRLKGKDRFATSRVVADTLKEELGIDKFDVVILVDGRDFADALAGSYLAAKKSAPILMVDKKNQGNFSEVKNYIANNMNSNGTVYILGGEVAVPTWVETELTGYTVKRLKGQNRYGTNLAILNEAGVTDEPILVCNAKNFADSLSASATGLPLLLVGSSLNAQQKEFLAAHTGNNIYVLGGTGAVNADVEEALKVYGTVERVKGSNRYGTSVEIAKKFFDTPDSLVLAYARNFPDGLAGGPLAYAMGAPLLLVDTDVNVAHDDFAVEYAQTKGISTGYVLGGAGLVKDQSAIDILGKTPVLK